MRSIFDRVTTSTDNNSVKPANMSILMAAVVLQFCSKRAVGEPIKQSSGSLVMTVKLKFVNGQRYIFVIFGSRLFH